MKTVILAGGFGTRLTEETALRPKPMVEIGEKPMLWHIMKIYSAHGINDFIICCGYKAYVIKEYFANYFLHQSDVTLDLRNNKMEVHQHSVEPWKVTLIDTGDKTLTGGRLKRVRPYVGDETFCMTYGDGLTDLDIRALIGFHKEQKTLATLTAVQPPGRFGAFNLSEKQTKIPHFREKSQGDGAWINGGFFVLEPGVFDYIAGDSTTWEQEPLQKMAHDGQLSAYRHGGFWQNMDTLRDKMLLEDLWASGKPPWKVWQ
ncbi:MAG TPA: glucose-1-phosphate cytidylyltransferase [Kiritimatiellia bacterium]|nr:glucose-1-phosphate cytidylyltransferase [Kiritimatiellia bacterium]HRZ12165.1 glucose-1-phosphate cytidylyltransferase [Kiritimatiellia bacterium]HSA18077.1 glucose-1-phosphate cytidylyltransferase [Kiritimatiellia bacterium]